MTLKPTSRMQIAAKSIPKFSFKKIKKRQMLINIMSHKLVKINRSHLFHVKIF
jgi:hypothetical protein